MKRKTDFKQMYLVDDTLYNRISNVTPQIPTTMIEGPYSQAPYSQPFPNEPNIKREFMEHETPTQTKIMKSSGMMTQEISTPTKIMKTSGMMTENVSTPTKIMKSSGMMTENVAHTTLTSQQHQINELQEQLHNSQLQVCALETSLHTPTYSTPPQHSLPPRNS